METWDALRARRNVREYQDRPIREDDLDTILEAGRRTPSSMNQQAWDFVVVTERDRLRELARVWRYATHVERSAKFISFDSTSAPTTSARRLRPLSTMP